MSKMLNDQGKLEGESSHVTNMEQLRFFQSTSQPFFPSKNEKDREC